MLNFIKIYAIVIRDKKMEVGIRMKVGYLKISPLETNENEQIANFKRENNIQRMFWEKISIKTNLADMEEYSRMVRYLQEGDVLIVPEFARLSKSVIELFQMVNQLNEKGIILVSLRENFDSNSDDGKLLIKSLQKIADFESRVLLQRRREGIAKAKAEGKYKGGGRFKERPADFEKYEQMYRSKEMKVVDIAKHFHVSRVTTYKWIKELQMEKLQHQYQDKDLETT